MDATPDNQRLRAAIAARPEVSDVVVVDRVTADGTAVRVAYLTPAGNTRPRAARRAASAAALTSGVGGDRPLLTAVLAAIPRAADGTADAAALAAVPVAEGATGRVVEAHSPLPARLHLADLLDLPSRWATRLSAGPAVDTPPPLDAPPAGSDGGPLATAPGDPQTMPEALLRAAKSWPDRGLHLVEADGTRTLAFPQLLTAARRALTGLRSAGLTVGDPVILHAPALTDHFVAFWAALLGGLRPVTVAQAPGYADRNATLDKFEHAWRTLGQPVVLSGGATLAGLRGYADRAGLTGLRVLDVADLAGHDPADRLHTPDPADVAMLQLSSGSTSKSKVIPLTHRGLVQYAQGARQAGRCGSGQTFLNWLPLDHVAGIVMMHLAPTVLGCDNVHVPTTAVLADPLLWLDLLERHEVRHSWSPNFGYKLVVEALRTQPDRSWDLGRLRSLINAGEQCTEQVMREFVAATRPFGITADTLLLAWGMAETCTAISYQVFDATAVQHLRLEAAGTRVRLLDEPEPGSTTLLSMGPAAPGSRFRIAGPDGAGALPELHIGRLQVRSERVLPGYLHNDEANEAAFPDGEWFDTGDLAFLAGDRMTITGRGKEIIIVNGVHYFCHEVEDIVGAVDGVVPSFVAAVGAPAADGIEQMVVLFVPAAEPDAVLLNRVRQQLAARLQVTAATLIAVGADLFDKTTSGKVQRTAMRARLLAGGYDAALRRTELLDGGARTVPDCLYRPGWEARDLPVRACGEPTLLIADLVGLAGALHGLLPHAELAGLPRDQDPEYWPRLLDRLRTADRLPQRIVYAAGYRPTPDPADDAAVAEALRACADEPLRLLQALAAAGWTGELMTLSAGLHRIEGDEPGCYPAALTAALGEAAAVEQPELRTWHLDLPGADPVADAQVVADAMSWLHREPVLAWRGRPLARVLHPVAPTPAQPMPTALAPGSRWLVTGGLGGIARAALSDLAAELGLRLLITGRTPAEQRGAELAMLAGGDPDQVRYAAVDVTDRAALTAAVEAAELGWGAGLDGVLHLAGEYQFDPLTTTDPGRWRALASAKVEGSLAVAAILAARPGSALVMFSSLLSLLPAAGVSAYAAGNRFAEALCEHLAADRPVRCLSWGLWRSTGLSDGHPGIEDAARRNMHVLSPAEGRALLRVALTQPAGALAVGIDPNTVRVRSLIRPAGRPLEAVAAGERQLDAFGVEVATGPPGLDGSAPPPVATGTGRVPQTGAPAPSTAGAPAPFAAVAVGAAVGPPGVGRDAIGVANVVRTVLRQAVPGGVGDHVPFLDAGLDSVRLLRLHALLQQGLGHEFPLTTLFSHGTQAALIAHLTEQFAPAGRAAAGPAASGADRRIAVVGMALRFPGADTAAQYWDNLLAGRVSTRRFSRAELLAAGLPAGLVDDPDYVPVSGALADIAGFDADLFGISAREAALMAPQQRLFLQICHEALQHGGYEGTDRRVGVYAGTGMHLYSLRTYLRDRLGGGDPADQLGALQVTIGNEPDFLVTRAAYKLGLTGPAMTVQTACSTSLVAVHLAVQSLLSGETDLALAGASAVHVPHAAGYRYEQGSILSRTGACRPFDAAADGTVGGNGVAAVLLKRLDAAIADGDTVHGVIIGSAVNNDGSAKSGYTAPSVAGHTAVVRAALAAAGVGPETVGYLETHGTGTLVGDPIEVEALRAVFGDRAAPLPLGAAKANLGHLDTCAGMAGLIKALLAVRHGQVPPIAGLTEPNPQLRIADGPFRLPTAVQPWTGPEPRRAGVSSLGVGGTNAHVVVEQPPDPPVSVAEPRPGTLPPARHTAPVDRHVVPLSAASPAALAELAGRHAALLTGERPPGAADLLATLGAGRRPLRHRLVAWADSADGVADVLRAHAAGHPEPSRPGGSAGRVTGTAGDPGPVVFAFTGQGADCVDMAAGLMSYEPAREILEACARQHRATWGEDLLAPMYGAARQQSTATVQPALFAMQVALAGLLDTLGVRPDVLIGHSAGEYAALCVAGALSVEDGLHLAAVRGQLMQRGTPEGGALAVLGDPDEARRLREQVPGLELSVRNGPRNTVFCGPPAAVRAAAAVLDAAGTGYRVLAVHRAFHSALLDPILDELARQAAALDWRPLRHPLVTNVGGVRLPAGTVLGPEHVRRHTRQTAEFGAGVDGLVADGCRTFVELGPDATLTGLGRQWPGTRWTPVQRGPADRAAAVTAALGALYCQAVAVDWAALAPHGRRVPLPTYPYRLQPHWALPAAPQPAPIPGGSPVMSPAPHAAPQDEAVAVVVRRVRDLTAEHLGEQPDRIPADAPFFDLGADSLLMINMLRELETGFGVRVPMRELFEQLDTPQLLGEAIVQRMDPARITALFRPAATQSSPAPDPSQPGAKPQLIAPPPPAFAVQAVAEPLLTVPSPTPLAAQPTGGPPPEHPTAATAADAAPLSTHDSTDPAGAATGAAAAVAHAQLELMGRFADLMSQQLAAVTEPPAATPPVPQQPSTAHPSPVPAQRGPAADGTTPAATSVNGSSATASSGSPGGAGQLGPRPLGPVAGMSGGRLDDRQQAHLADLIRRYTAKTAASKRVTQQQRARLADSRAVVGFRGATKEMLYPIAARRAQGAHLEDIDGNGYVDITMGFGTLLFGHEPAFLTDAVNGFLADGLRLGPRSVETGEAAQLLCELTGMDRAAFSTSGTEANSAAFRLARAHTGRSVIVTFDGSYHGHFDAVLGRSVRDGARTRTVGVSAGIPDSAVADMLVLPYGDPRSLEQIAAGAARIAAVVVEPVPSRHPDRQPVEFVRALRELCDRHGIVLMFDEMLTGFRPHPQGAQGVFGVRADLATYGKVIGGGFPIGAIAGRADIMDWIDGGFWRYGDDSRPEQDTTFFGGTYIQHPVSMVAAKAVLTRLRERGPALQDTLNRHTDRLARELNAFCAEQEFPLRVHHFGSLFRFASTTNLDLLFNHLLLAGVHVWEWRNFFLSDAHTDADVDFVADAVRQSLLELRGGGFLPGGPAAPAATHRPLPSPVRFSPYGTRTTPPVLPAPVPGTPSTPATRPAAPVRAAAGARVPVEAPAGTGRPDFSLYFFGDYPLGTAADRYDAILAAAEYADTHGLHAVWLPERHFDSFGGIFPNPSVLAAAIAARTSRVRLHSGCAVLPLHDPIRVAEEWSVVDNLSGGRVGLGCASGWHARDFALAPQAYGTHRDVMYQHIDTVRTLWSGRPIERTAGNGEPVQLRLFPTPVQQMPPFFTAVIGNPDSYRKAAAADLGVITNLMAQSPEQLADNIALYRAARAEHGLDPAAGRVVLLLHTFLGDDTAAVRDEAFAPFCDYLRSSLALFGQVTNSLGVTIDLDSTPAEDVDFLLRRAYQRYCADRALIGSPQDCAPLIEMYTAMGVDEIGCFVDFGLTPQRMLAGLPGIEQLSALTRPGASGRHGGAGPGPTIAARPVTGAAEPVAPAGAGSDPVALTETQRQIWFVERTFPGRPTYTETKFVRLDGPLDIMALQAAIDLVVARHPTLRSTFPEVDGEPRQVVAPAAPRPLPLSEATGLTDEEAVDAAIRQEAAHTFDPATGPLFAPRLVRLAADRHLLVMRMHHLVVDTVSAGIISREIAAGYRARRAGISPQLPAAPPWPLPAPDTDPDRTDAGLAYWTATLAGASRLALPTDRPRPAEPNGIGGVQCILLDAELTARITAFARGHRVTTFMVLLAAFATVLRRLSGQRDVVLGTPVAHRPVGSERAVGLFVNTLALRLQVPDTASLADLARAARSVVLDAQEHSGVPFQQVVRALGADSDPLRQPLFDVVIEFDNEAVFELDLPDVRATLLDAAVERAPFDFGLFLTDLGGTIRCQIDYATDLFDPPAIRRVLDRLALVLDTGTAHPDLPLTALPQLSAAEAEELAAWSDGGPPVPGADELIPGRLTPVALDPGDLGTLSVTDAHGTFGATALRQRASAVAGALSAAGIGSGDLVAVHLPRSADAVAAMTGVLWTGAGYVPLDPQQPMARLAGIAADAGVRAVLSRSDLTAVATAAPLMLIDRLAEPAEPVKAATPHPGDVAYVLFTSGSTGRPKGCVIEHGAIANTVAWFSAGLQITAGDRFAWFCSPGFDASATEVWPAVMAGAGLHIVPDEVRPDPVLLRDWLIANGITVTLLPTPMAELLLDLDWSAGPRPALRHLIAGGDRLRRGARASLPFQLTNVYGPTEATVVSTWTHVPPGAEDAPPIGRPVPGTHVRVLDDDGRPASVGMPGELLLGGAQLARGYLADPALTAERFLDHPEHGRLYRTGDVVRWRRDGQLEFIGRNDAQVQIRGFRVEPGEVEHHLRNLPGVRDAAVRAWTAADGEVMLAGYVVPAGTGVGTGALARALAERLPDYMVPTGWTLLPALPTTTSGKLDRAALPAPDRRTAATGTAAGPATDLQWRLHDIWCTELDLPSVSTTATFFELGGHSLAAVRLLNRVQADLGRTLGVLEFLRHPTIGAMAQRLGTVPDTAETGSAATAVPGSAAAAVSAGTTPAADPWLVERTGPASVNQARQYRITVGGDTPSMLTIALRFTLRGDLDQGALAEALTALTDRHPALRTRYAVVDGEVQQEVLATRPVPVPEIDLSGADVADAARDWAAQPFALDDEPGFRAGLLRHPADPAADRRDGGHWELVLAMHHGISDGVSTLVLVRDLAALYRARLAGQRPDLPELTVDFLDYARWEAEYLAHGDTRRMITDWARDAGEDLLPIQLPTDHPRRPGARSQAGAAYHAELPPDLVEQLNAYAYARHATPYAVLCGVFAWLLHQQTGEPGIALTASVANRPHPRWEEVVGVFTHSPWLVVRVDGARHLDDLVDRATAATWQVLAMQSVPLPVESSALGAAFAGEPPRVYLTMLDAQNPVLDLPGLAPAPAQDVELAGSRADQTWGLRPTPEGAIAVSVEYATALFTAETVAASAERYERLLRELLADPQTALPPPGDQAR